jgi:tetratricopeptide (TPR) repeat protein
MLQQLFTVMNEVLDDIIRYYPKVDKQVQKQMDEQITVLRTMSDTIIEEWLHFEEKMAALQQQMHMLPQNPKHQAVAPPPMFDPDAANAALESASEPAPHAATASGAEQEDSEAVQKGQGYFKLFMFQQAAAEFERVVRNMPDFDLARIFLAMTYMHLKEWEEAKRHFQLIIALTDHPKWQAMGLNALGCIQAIQANMEQAESYFQKAHEADPTFAGPLDNLTTCRRKAGHLSLYFGSGELCCL